MSSSTAENAENAKRNCHLLVLIVHLLRDGGRGAIVLPDSTHFGESIKTRITQELLEKCHLHTIVRLPNGVFAPETGSKTNLLSSPKANRRRKPGITNNPLRRA